MKKIIIIFFILISQFWTNGCSSDEFLDNELAFPKSKFMLDHGIMNFENQNVFDSLVRVLSEKDSEFLQNWEDAYNFQSLRSIYEKAIYEEELFLEKQVAKYGDDPSITREKIGYSEYTLRFLKNESITLDDYVSSPEVRPFES